LWSIFKVKQEFHGVDFDSCDLFILWFSEGKPGKYQEERETGNLQRIISDYPNLTDRDDNSIESPTIFNKLPQSQHQPLILIPNVQRDLVVNRYTRIKYAQVSAITGNNFSFIKC
jgi:hypothetical protein